MKLRNVQSSLRRRRLVAGLTAAELAQASGVHISSIQRYERGERRPSAERLQRIEAALLEALPKNIFGAGRRAGESE